MNIADYRSLNIFFTDQEIHDTFITVSNLEECPFHDCDYCSNLPIISKK